MSKSCLILTAFATLVLAGPLFAHARLVSSVPAAHAQIAAAPPTLTLTFTENVKLASLTLASAGKATPLPLDANAAAAKTVVVPIAALGAGDYEVRWTAISSDDGHITKGSFQFTVLGAAANH